MQKAIGRHFDWKRIQKKKKKMKENEEDEKQIYLINYNYY